MGEWKPKSKKPNQDSLIMKAVTLGVSAVEYDYKLEHRETGEIRTFVRTMMTILHGRSRRVSSLVSDVT
jgi:hypothetical protein